MRPSGYDYPVSRFDTDFALEFLDVFTTLVPQLFPGMTRDEAASNRDKFGFLSCEWDPRIMAWMCTTALSSYDVVSASL